MPVAEVYLEVEQGMDKVLGPFQFWTADPSGLGNPASAVPVDFTGWTAKMQVKSSQSAGSTTLVTYTSPTQIAFSSQTQSTFPPAPANPNAFSITVAAADTTNLTPGVYYYDIVLTAPTTLLKQVWQKGLFVITATGTR